MLIFSFGNLTHTKRLIICILGYGAWCIYKNRPLREPESGFEFVYVNQDGSVRELSPNEQTYLSQEFSGADSGRPYIKSNYKSSDGWGSQSGFLARRQVPLGVPILAVHPNYDAALDAAHDAALKELGEDWSGLGVHLAVHKAAGDIIVKNADGSIMCSPNPDISAKDRLERMRSFELAQQRQEESLAKR